MENPFGASGAENVEVSNAAGADSLSWDLTPQKEEVMFQKMLAKTFFFSLLFIMSLLGRMRSMDLSMAL